MENVKECQSCAMQMKETKDFGTEKDGNASVDYCCHCYKDGDFTWKPTFNEFFEGNIEFWEKEGNESDDEFRVRVRNELANLKRWKTA